MLHEALVSYLAAVEVAVLRCDPVYVERYVEEILTPERVNLRLRLRFDHGYLLEIHEAVILSGHDLMHLDYRYHCQDERNRLVFRYDSTPHFPDLASFPYHKHLPDTVIATDRPEIEAVLQKESLIYRHWAQRIDAFFKGSFPDKREAMGAQMASNAFCT